jgi:hypothetical protein
MGGEMAGFFYSMGKNFLDTHLSTYFKTSKDGRRLFYPGLSRRGYVIPSENDYQRVVQQLKKYIIASIVLVIVFGAVGGFLGLIIGSTVGAYLGMFIGGVLYLIFYKLVLTPNLVRGMESSDERLSVRDRATAQALTISPKWLWSWGVTAPILLAIGIAMLFDEPVDWFGALLLIAMAVVCAVAATYFLFLRRRASNPQTPR